MYNTNSLAVIKIENGRTPTITELKYTSACPSLLPSARMRSEGYCSWSVCVCVCVYRSVTALAASASAYTSNQRYSRVFLRLDFFRGFSKNPSVQKLWCEKANMQIS